MSLLQTIKNHIDGKQSSVDMKRDERSREKARKYGINPTGAIVFENRSVITGSTPTSYGELKTSEKDFSIFDHINVYENPFVNVSVPYMTPNGIEWKQDGAATENHQLNSKKLKPYRITTYCNVSNTLLNAHQNQIKTDGEPIGNEDFKNQIINGLDNAIKQKITESIFSTFSGTTDQPQGILYDVSATTITSGLTDLISMQYDGDKNKTHNVWVISPKAKKELLSINANIFNDGKLLGSDYIALNEMEDGFIAYLPLDLIVMALWTIASVDVDSVTEARNGITRVIINSFADFDYLDKFKIQLGKFE